MNRQAEPSMLTHIVAQLRALERRSHRRAVWVSIAVPVCLNTETVLQRLRDALRGADGIEPEVDLVPSTDGRPRLLTVDFDLKEAL
tara:strand:- start:492 stop:749 length:258 start_codon:yes stop_codon:yes gene_type:complete